jgi:hypothetical protein
MHLFVQAVELAAAAELEAEGQKEAAMLAKRERLREEPPAGPATTHIRISLPQGKRIERRFLRTETLAVRCAMPSKITLRHIFCFGMGRLYEILSTSSSAT